MSEGVPNPDRKEGRSPLRGGTGLFDFCLLRNSGGRFP